MPSHVLKKIIKLTLIQFVAKICKDYCQAFSLSDQAGHLPGFVKGSNLPLLYI